MVEPRIGHRSQGWFGAIGDAQARRFDHRDVVRTVADREYG